MGEETGIMKCHLVSPAPTAFCALSVLAAPFFCRVIPILAGITPFPFGCLLSLLCKCLFRLGL